MSGTAVLIVVLRQSPQPATHAIAVEPTASHLRLATALGRLVQEPQVSEKLKKHVADWVEGEQFRRMQMELAIYIKSERFHDLLINSFRGFQRGQGATSAANGMSVD